MSASNTATKTPTKTPAQTAKAGAAKSGAASTAPSVIDDDPLKAVAKLEEKTKAVNANNIARVANSHVRSDDEKLEPLVSLRTDPLKALKVGRQIERFPKTPKDIEKLNYTMVDTMLLALEGDRSGDEAAKRKRLREQIGLNANPA